MLRHDIDVSHFHTNYDFVVTHLQVGIGFFISELEPSGIIPNNFLLTAAASGDGVSDLMLIVNTRTELL